jgi:hypothetical protein
MLHLAKDDITLTETQEVSGVVSQKRLRGAR